MFELYFAFLFYFGPLLLCEVWYLSRKQNLIVLANWLVYVAGALVAVSPFLVTLKLVPNIIGTGIYASWIWWSLFVGCVLTLKLKGYALSHSTFVALITVFLATETWELPIHVLTVKLNPSLEQLAVTVMLSLPYLLLAVPLWHEARNKRWQPPKTFSIPTCMIFAFSIGVAMLDAKPSGDIQYLMRIVMVGFWLAFAWGFPKKEC
ncbi:MAG: hypothetical protein HWN68_13220 [Desulfobacterales bacterium]|nr:hypothetical protein [Desulfobacterales bacterium]